MRLRFGKDRAFFQSQANHQSDDHQHCAEQEGNAPAPNQELILRHECHYAQECDIGQDQTRRRADLNEAAIESAPVWRRVFHRHQDCAAPFSANTDALKNSHRHQQDGRPDADLFVGGKQTDDNGGQAHAQEAKDEHVFAAQTVAKVPDDHAAQGPGYETYGKSRESCQLTGDIGDIRKEQGSEDQRCRRGVDEKVIPLESGSNETGKQYFPSLIVANAGSVF